MTTLPAILRGKSTDKVLNGFASVYDEIFYDRREYVDSVLEIGIDQGGSIQGWLEYFPNAMIYGIDNRPEALENYGKRFVAGLVDVGDYSSLQGFLHSTNPKPFDLVIDDGSHKFDDIIPAFSTLWPYVRPHGYYVIEDTQVDERVIPHFCELASSQTRYGVDVEAITFRYAMVIMQKGKI